MAHELKAHTVLAEDSGPISIPHMATNSQFQGIWYPLPTSASSYTCDAQSYIWVHIHAQRINKYFKRNKLRHTEKV